MASMSLVHAHTTLTLLPRKPRAPDLLELYIITQNCSWQFLQLALPAIKQHRGWWTEREWKEQQEVLPLQNKWRTLTHVGLWKEVARQDSPDYLSGRSHGIHRNYGSAFCLHQSDVYTRYTRCKTALFSREDEQMDYYYICFHIIITSNFDPS